MSIRSAFQGLFDVYMILILLTLKISKGVTCGPKAGTVNRYKCQTETFNLLHVASYSDQISFLTTT